MIRKLVTSVAIAASVIVSGIAQAKMNFSPLEGDPEEINFGLISTESSSALKAQWLPLMEDMEETLGMKVKPFFASDYAGVIEAMRFGKVHVAWLGNKAAIEAVDRSGGEVFVQMARADGGQGYYSHIITYAKNDKINSLDDILTCDKSLNFGIGDPNSTSGFLVPSYYVFAQRGIDPKKCFKTVRNAGHETNLMAVANRQVDVATNNSEQIGRSRLRAPEAVAKIKVIWTSPLIPSDPIVYRKDMSRELKSRIKAFFLSYGRMGDVDAAKEVLSKIDDAGLDPFLESSNAQLYPIRQLNLFKEKLKIQANEGLDAKEKAARLKKIDKKLSDLAIMISAQ